MILFVNTLAYRCNGDCMKIFTIGKRVFIMFIFLIICICSMVTITIGEAIYTNATPTTNKTIILDARASEFQTMGQRVKTERQNKNLIWQ